jgi:PQQ-like domain
MKYSRTNRTATLLALGMVAIVLSKPVFGWQVSLRGDGTTSSDRGLLTVVDGHGDVITAGVLGGGPTAAAVITVVKHAGGNGELLWRWQTQGRSPIQSDLPSALALDPQGDVVVAGVVTNPSTDSYRDAFVAKISGRDGSQLWLQMFTGSGELSADYASAMGLDARGDVFVAATIASGDDETSASDFVVLKLAGESGDPMWRIALIDGARGYGVAQDLRVDTLGNVIASGAVPPPDGSVDAAVVVKLAGADGTEIWRRRLPQTSAAVLTVSPEGTVAVGADELIVSLLNGDDGSLIWRRNLTAEDVQTQTGPLLFLPNADLLATGALVIFSAQTGDTAPWGAFPQLCNGERFASGGAVVFANGDLLRGGYITVPVPKPPRPVSEPPLVHTHVFAMARYAGDSREVQWCTIIPGTSTAPSGPADVVIAPDGSVIAVGRIGYWGRATDLAVVKLDPETGVVRWQVRVDGPAAEGPDQVTTVALDAAGDVFAAGSQYNDPTDIDFTVAKLGGADGALRWTRSFSGSKPGAVDFAKKVVADDRGDAVAVGWLENAESIRDLAVFKLAGANGAELWEFVTDGGALGDDSAVDAVLTRDDGVAVAGVLKSPSTGTDIAVLKFDEQSGAERWRAVIDGPASGDDEAFAIASDSVGDVLVAGQVSGVASYLDFIVAKFDGRSGREKWRRILVGDTEARDAAFAVAVDAADDVIAGGRLAPPGQVTATFVVKLAGGDGREMWRYSRAHAEREEGVSALVLDSADDVVATSRTFYQDTVQDFEVLKLSGRSGELRWSTRLNGVAGHDTVFGVSLDPWDNPVAVGTVAGDYYDFAVAKLDGNLGGVLWERYLSGPPGPLPTYDVGYAVAVDRRGDVVAGGILSSYETGPDFSVVKLRGVDGLDFQGNVCACDCDGNRAVGIDEIVTAVNIALGERTLAACVAADIAGDGVATIDDLLAGVNASLRGCERGNAGQP